MMHLCYAVLHNKVHSWAVSLTVGGCVFRSPVFHLKELHMELVQRAVFTRQACFLLYTDMKAHVLRAHKTG